MKMTAEAFEQLALADPDSKWELYCGEPRKKPSMTFEHNEVADSLAFMLAAQLDRRFFRVRIDKGRVRRPGPSFFIPDMYVIPHTQFEQKRGQRDRLEFYDQALPLVVEVWSASTGGYDQNVKLEEYRRQGDLEIWLMHPYERTVNVWRRSADGSYEHEVVTGGTLRPAFLPDVSIDLDTLFDA